MQTNANHESGRHQEFVHSKHSSKRTRQRGFPRDIIPLIKAYGVKSHDGMGGVRYLLTKASIARIESVVGHTQRLDGLAGAYVVVSTDEGTIITVGHRDT